MASTSSCLMSLNPNNPGFDNISVMTTNIYIIFYVKKIIYIPKKITCFKKKEDLSLLNMTLSLTI